MSYFDDSPRQRRAAAQARRVHHRRMAIGGLIVAVLMIIMVVVTILTVESGGEPSSTHKGSGAKGSQVTTASGHSTLSAAHSGTASAVQGTGVPGHATVPILMYHVINPPPAGAAFPGLYVPSDEFAAQMQALKAAGWHAVTMDQLEANWTRGVPLGPGKPIVLSFDNGYASQYNNALPVLQRIGWVGVENIQLSGLPPSQGGFTDAQVRGLIKAGWELDTQGISHADLIRLDSAELHYQVVTARQMLRSRYGVPVNWFCYPSGHYDATVIDEVRSAGFVGSTTVVPGWAGPASNRFALPRLRVLGGTSPTALLAQIATAEGNQQTPGSYGGA